MPTNLQSSVALFGRFLVSIIFLLSGLNKVMHWSATADMMAAPPHNMPAVPFLLTCAILVEILGGLAMLLGWHTRIAALMLFLYLIPTTLIFHNFWDVATAQAQQTQMINFLKNLAIMGGLLEICAFGAGAISLDAEGIPFRTWKGARPPDARPVSG